MAEPPAYARAPEPGQTISDETLNRSIATKMFIEQHYTGLMSQMRERHVRKEKLEAAMESENIPAKERQELRRQLGQKETVYMRMKRQRMSERDFEKIRVIGRGAFGEVWVVKKNETGEVFAMKKLKKAEMLQKDQVAHVRAERDILVAGHESPWVVKLNYSFQDPKYLYLVMEYLAGGDMMTMLIKYDTFPEDWARFYIAELVLALESVHDFGYIHRDIKPDNLLLDKEGHLKLTDFGLCTGFHPMHSSSFYENLVDQARSYKLGPIQANSAEKFKTIRLTTKQRRQLAYSTVGTPDYTAPEVFLQSGYGRECDFWSVGCILFEMLIGYPPFIADSSTETCLKIINWTETLKFPAEPVISDLARDLIQKLICDGRSRLSTAADMKAHPWFATVVWDSFRERYAAPVVPKLKSATDTSNFDQYEPQKEDEDDLAAAVAGLEYDDDEAPSAAAARAQPPDPHFIGYTYRGFDGLMKATGSSAPPSAAQQRNPRAPAKEPPRRSLEDVFSTSPPLPK
eukprot:m51a1_g14183 putative serine threonine-protein kinase 38 isoform x1 (515) ;mRNA; f:63208-65033